ESIQLHQVFVDVGLEPDFSGKCRLLDISRSLDALSVSASAAGERLLSAPTSRDSIAPKSDAVFVVAHRTRAHQERSSPEVFQQIVDHLLLYMRSNRVAVPMTVHCGQSLRQRKRFRRTTW